MQGKHIVGDSNHDHMRTNMEHGVNRER
jgi:hypothetical protein